MYTAHTGMQISGRIHQTYKSGAPASESEDLAEITTSSPRSLLLSGRWLIFPHQQFSKRDGIATCSH